MTAFPTIQSSLTGTVQSEFNLCRSELKIKQQVAKGSWFCTTISWCFHVFLVNVPVSPPITIPYLTINHDFWMMSLYLLVLCHIPTQENPTVSDLKLEYHPQKLQFLSFKAFSSAMFQAAPPLTPAASPQPPQPGDAACEASTAEERRSASKSCRVRSSSHNRCTTSNSQPSKMVDNSLTKISGSILNHNLNIEFLFMLESMIHLLFSMF